MTKIEDSEPITAPINPEISGRYTLSIGVVQPASINDLLRDRRGICAPGACRLRLPPKESCDNRQQEKDEPDGEVLNVDAADSHCQQTIEDER